MKTNRRNNYFIYDSVAATISVLMCLAVLFVVHGNYIYKWEIVYAFVFWVITEIILFLKNRKEEFKENDS